MLIELNFQENNIIKYLESAIINLITFFYGWAVNENTVLLGYILGVVHVTFATLVGITIFISHTFYPSFWFQFGCLVFLILIWLQHIFLKVCVVTIAENKLTNSDISPFHDLVHELLGISGDVFINNIIVIETVAVLFLGLSISSRVSLYIYKLYNIDF